jgi:hypothetical protein
MYVLRGNYLQTNIAVTQIGGGAVRRARRARSDCLPFTVSLRGAARLSRALSSPLIDVTNERLSHEPHRKTHRLHHTRRNGCTPLTLLQLHQLRLTALSPLYCDPHPRLTH